MALHFHILSLILYNTKEIRVGERKIENKNKKNKTKILQEKTEEEETKSITPQACILLSLHSIL